MEVVIKLMMSWCWLVMWGFYKFSFGILLLSLKRIKIEIKGCCWVVLVRYYVWWIISSTYWVLWSEEIMLKYTMRGPHWGHYPPFQEAVIHMNFNSYKNWEFVSQSRYSDYFPRRKSDEFPLKQVPQFAIMAFLSQNSKELFISR